MMSRLTVAEKMPWTVYDPAIQFFELDYMQICLLMYKNPKSGDREPFLHMRMS